MKGFFDVDDSHNFMSLVEMWLVCFCFISHFSCSFCAIFAADFKMQAAIFQQV